MGRLCGRWREGEKRESRNKVLVKVSQIETGKKIGSRIDSLRKILPIWEENAHSYFDSLLKFLWKYASHVCIALDRP